MCTVLVVDIFIVSDPKSKSSEAIIKFLEKKKENIPRMNATLCLFVLLCEIAHMNEHVSSTECLVLCQILTFCFPNIFNVVKVKLSP